MTAAAALIGLPATGVHAETFDGKWMADIPAQGACRGTATMTVIVAGHDLAIHVQNVGSPGNFTGTVDDNGVGTFSSGRTQGSITFSGGHFEAQWYNATCQRHAQGDRALDDGQKSAATADRKRHQDVYADLVKRAEAGEKVDYTQLRAEAVYAPDWDFYDTKTAPLLQQADASAKGKDCPAALPKLDLVIKMDFINDAAHDVRADCLKQTGVRDKAAVERKIADGLIHSLMDSGDGKTERSAYVVSTQREEQDVLANRHIRLRTRQSEVRGSDGRYYDVIQGITITNDGLVLDVTPHTYYFDISSFVGGRASKRAAVETIAATIR